MSGPDQVDSSVQACRAAVKKAVVNEVPTKDLASRLPSDEFNRSTYNRTLVSYQGSVNNLEAMVSTLNKELAVVQYLASDERSLS